MGWKCGSLDLSRAWFVLARLTQAFQRDAGSAGGWFIISNGLSQASSYLSSWPAVPQEASPARSHGSRGRFLERVDAGKTSWGLSSEVVWCLSLVAVGVNCKAGPGSRGVQTKFITWWRELQVSKLIALLLLITLGKSRLIHCSVPLSWLVSVITEIAE